MVKISFIINLLYNCLLFLAQKYPDDHMTAIQEIAMTGHSGHQYQATSDLMEGIESEHTMKDMEYQVDTNNVAHKINVHVVA